MAYAGTTAATTAQNIPLRMTAFGIHGGFTTALTTSISPTTNGYGPPNKQSAGWWQYHTTDASSVLTTTGYFSDGHTLGMKSGDEIRGLSQLTSANAGYQYSGTLAVTTNGAFIASTATMFMSSR